MQNVLNCETTMCSVRSLGTNQYSFGDMGTKLLVWGPSPKFGDSWHLCLRVLFEYSVPAPNSLWHLDGYHKLIRWGLVIHGGIDGYSRLITYPRVSTNNRSGTVLKCFLEAVHEYGLPSRVRSD